MTKVKLEILGLSSSVDTQTGSFALVLKEEKGERRLPIIIGMFEAQSIAMEIEKIIPNRPMTHDLFKSLSKKIKYSVKKIILSQELMENSKKNHYEMDAITTCII